MTKLVTSETPEAQRAPFAVGEWVTTDLDLHASRVRRRVTVVQRQPGWESGWGVAADGGAPCPICARPVTESTRLVASDWFRRVEDLTL